SLRLAFKLGGTLPILTLIGLSLLKLLFLEVCLQTGWVGGDIFPITFASLLHGFAIAQLFPAYDSLFIIATVSLTLASTLLENELLALIFISLFFPLEILPLAVVLLGLFKIKNYYLTQRGKQ
ncbi:MAG: chloride transporter, partial [Ligilactobacillus sp.]|nr:chloride transporter [Ligilactobacillus sp.]